MQPNSQIKYPSLIASLFTNSFVDKVISNKHVPFINGIFKQTGFNKTIKKEIPVKTALLKAFTYLNQNYRCEYVFKTAILDEVLLKRHDLINSVYLTEFRAFNAKADIVILNGTSTVYEIKSDVDNLDRLLSQITAYQRIFDKVFVVSNEANKDSIAKVIPNTIGIIVLNKNLTITTIREAHSNIGVLNKESMFDSLRKPEYLFIIKKHFGYIPDVPGTLIHGACKTLFKSLPNEIAHSYFLQTLKCRQLSKEQIQLLSASNKSLRGLLAEKYYSKNECEIIKFGLNKVLTV